MASEKYNARKAIILAILVLFGFAAMVFVSFLLIGNHETEEINNKTSE